MFCNCLKSVLFDCAWVFLLGGCFLQVALYMFSLMLCYQIKLLMYVTSYMYTLLYYTIQCMQSICLIPAVLVPNLTKCDKTGYCKQLKYKIQQFTHIQQQLHQVYCQTCWLAYSNNVIRNILQHHYFYRVCQNYTLDILVYPTWIFHMSIEYQLESFQEHFDKRQEIWFKIWITAHVEMSKLQPK